MRLQISAIAVMLGMLGASSCTREERGAPAAKATAPLPPEVKECAEIQVFPRVDGEQATAGEVVRFRAKPGATIRLTRTVLTHEVFVTAGSTVGRSTQSNDYKAEDIRDVTADRTESFVSARHVVHCLAQRTD